MNSRLAIDLGVLLLYFVIIIAIGLRMGRKEDNLEDFALGRRQIPWWAVLASIIAAETSAGTFFGTPGEGFALRNYTYIQLAFGTILARILVSYIFIKPYYDYKVFSIYEYLTLRFGVGSKNAASAIFMFTRVLASGARLYVAAIALALAYEMIRGVRPGQAETLLIYIGATFAAVLAAVLGLSLIVGPGLAAPVQAGPADQLPPHRVTHRVGARVLQQPPLQRRQRDDTARHIAVFTGQVGELVKIE